MDKKSQKIVDNHTLEKQEKTFYRSIYSFKWIYSEICHYYQSVMKLSSGNDSVLFCICDLFLFLYNTIKNIVVLLIIALF